MTLTILPTKPVPQPTELSRPYWEAALQGQLVLQRCASCAKLRHYPRLICDRCWSDQVQWERSAARGEIHSWTVAHYAYHPAFADELPYVLVTVQLEEGVRALGRFLDREPQIGLRVQGRFEVIDGRADLVFETLRAG
jgi:uncharacterized OB-fold protein